MKEHVGPEFQDKTIEDCVSDIFFKEIWVQLAKRNTKYFQDIFSCVPTDDAMTMADNQKYIEKTTMAEIDKYSSSLKVKKIQGNLVLLPLMYLSEENLMPSITTKEGLAPTIMWT